MSVEASLFKDVVIDATLQNALAVSGPQVLRDRLHPIRLIGAEGHYTLKTPVIGPMTSQGSAGRCWIFAGMNVARVPVAASLNLKTLEFSQSFLAFHDGVEKANYFLNRVYQEFREADPLENRRFEWLLDSRNLFSDGGQFVMLQSLIEKYGLMPKSVYPDTVSDTKTLNYKNRVKKLLRAAAMEIQGVTTEEEFHKIRAVTLKRVYKILCLFLGTPPPSFEWRYTDDITMDQMTPLEFYQTVVKPVWNPLDFITVSHGPHRPLHRVLEVSLLGNVEGVKTLYLNTEIQDLLDLAKASLADGLPVWFGADWGKGKSVTEGLLAMNLSTAAQHFETPSLEEFPKGDRLRFGHSKMTHAMVLSAYDEHSDSFRVENSHGAKHLGKGFLRMSVEWFREHVCMIVAHKKHLSEELLSIYRAPEEQRIVLPPYDPMGALAM